MIPFKEIWLVRKLGNYFLGLNQKLWSLLPPSLLNTRQVQQYGHFLHKLVLIRGWRQPSIHTYMLRNRPELELIHSLAVHQPAGTLLRIAVVACSTGMEVYSIKWALRDLNKHVDIQLAGIDIDESVLAIARRGRYPLADFTWHFDLLTSEEHSQICPVDGDTAIVNEKLRSGIQWMRVDANDPALAEKIGQQDIVVANRFLCHMQPWKASSCLRSIASLVSPGGYLFVTGVDLDVRQGIMQELGFVPIAQDLEAIHNGDASLSVGWPWECWGLEPLDKRRKNWIGRYAMVYRKPGQCKHQASVKNRHELGREPVPT